MYHVLNNCAVVGGNGNGFDMSRRLISEFFPPPAPRSHYNTYRLSLFSIPLLSRRTRPLKLYFLALTSHYCTLRNLAYYVLSLLEMAVLLTFWIINPGRTANLPLWNYSKTYQVKQNQENKTKNFVSHKEFSSLF